MSTEQSSGPNNDGPPSKRTKTTVSPSQELSPALAASVDPFQQIGEDAHRHILGYVMCPPPTAKKPRQAQNAFFHYIHAKRDEVRRDHPTLPVSLICDRIKEMFVSLDDEQRQEWEAVALKDRRREAREREAFVSGKVRCYRPAFFFYCRANERRVVDANPDAGYEALRDILLKEYNALSEEDTAKWIEEFYKDCRRYEKEMSDSANSRRILLKSCLNVAFVSHAWRDLYFKLMHPGTPHGILSPWCLFALKSMAASLDLSDVYTSFFRALQNVGMSVAKDTDSSDRSDTYALQVVADGLGIWESYIAARVFSEYRKFLVVKSVEIAAGRMIDACGNSSSKDKARVRSSWMERSKPCQLVGMFWEQHASSCEKYEDDCRALIGEVIEYGHERSGNDACNFRSKARELFRFEDQLPPKAGISRGDVPDYFFEASFDLKETAEEMLFNKIAVYFDPSKKPNRRLPDFEGGHAEEPLLTLVQPDNEFWYERYE